MTVAVVDPRLQERAQAAADLLEERADRPVLVVHHIDADGVCAGAIASEALHRAGIPFDTLAVKSLDEAHVQKVREADAATLWFCDLGSTVYPRFPGTPKVVCDHHELLHDGTEDFPGHVNPLLDGRPGDDVSGAGTAFLVAYALDPRNGDLLPMALVGAAADLQDRGRSSVERTDAGGGSGGASDRKGGCFTGSNRALTDAGEAAGVVAREWDLGFYGPETRPLGRFLGYARERPVPGVTGGVRDAERFLRGLGIPLQAGGRDRVWNDLEREEKRCVRSALVQRRLDCGLDPDDLWREVVTLPAEARGPTRELQEFGTLLNATARYDRPEVGLAVARGDRGTALEEALDLRDGHKKHLVGALDVFARHGVQETRFLQWVHLQDQVRDTVVGIVCGMALGGLGLRQDLPLVGFAHTPDGRTKVSSRAPGLLQARGIDLAAAMRAGAEAVGGAGGGHKGAAGATIPRGAEARFLAAVEDALEKQG